MGSEWGVVLWARGRHGYVLLALVPVSILGRVKDGVQVLVVDVPWVLETLAGELEPEAGVEVLNHGAQSGLWCGEGQLSVGELLGQMLASGEVGKANAGLELV